MHATLEWRPAIMRQETNLAKELQKLGYRTGIIGKWHNMPNKVLPKRNKKMHEPNATYEMTKKFEKSIREYYEVILLVGGMRITLKALHWILRSKSPRMRMIKHWSILVICRRVMSISC